MGPLDTLAVGLLAGLLALERKAFLQAMASRPLVAGALIGIVLGKPYVGLSAGAALELFFLGAVNFGGVLPDNELFATCATAACACAMARSGGLDSNALLSISTLVMLPLAKVGKRADQICEQVNGKAAGGALCEGPVRARLRHNLFGLWLPFLHAMAITVAAALFGWLLLGPVLSGAPAAVLRALGLAWPAIFIVCAATALRSVRTARAGLYGGAAAVAMTALQAFRIFSP